MVLGDNLMAPTQIVKANKLGVWSMQEAVDGARVGN